MWRHGVPDCRERLELSGHLGERHMLCIRSDETGGYERCFGHRVNRWYDLGLNGGRADVILTGLCLSRDLLLDCSARRGHLCLAYVQVTALASLCGLALSTTDRCASISHSKRLRSRKRRKALRLTPAVHQILSSHLTDRYLGPCQTRRALFHTQYTELESFVTPSVQPSVEIKYKSGPSAVDSQRTRQPQHLVLPTLGAVRRVVYWAWGPSGRSS